ncbi:MAG: DNA cytosine methyltransferase [Patescibacteria group bacterium]|nr:DNA cytosine methyltransferase [Patescibacteria group bacterium]MDE1945605.1 DNA cytosine methyltransferase [Patescibacteria group bacterium]
MRAIDLFAGCGGFSLGMQKAGFRVVGAVDNWKPAVETYKKNFRDHDIFDVDLSDISESVKKLIRFKPNIIVGGPPCQDFSHAGKRDETRGRADLTVAYAKIISNIKPDFFIMENVDQITKSKKLVEARFIFKESGYGITEKVLDASLCGAPQKRKRFFMIGILNGADDYLEPYLNSKIAQKPMTLRDYFDGKLKTDFYYRHPRNYNRRGIYSIDEPSPTIRGVNRPIPKGYPGHKLDATDDFTKVRPLTTKERARIQTFPEKFVFMGSKTEIEQQIGNAVPVNLAQFVASAVMNYIKNPKKFSRWKKERQESLF